MQKIRTFVAIPVSPEVQKRAADLIKRLSASDANVNWVHPDRLHMTLKFLGDVPNTEVSQVCQAVARAAANRRPFTVKYEGVGVFPNRDRPRVMWIGVKDGMEPLTDLQESVDQNLRTLGFPPERRRFHAHLTVGRLRRSVASKALRDLIDQNEGYSAGIANVSELLVMASFLDKSGPTYDVMARFQLT